MWKKYPEHLHEWLLNLTEEFDLTFPMPNEDINLVPCLMPAEKPEVCSYTYTALFLEITLYDPLGVDES